MAQSADPPQRDRRISEILDRMHVNIQDRPSLDELAKSVRLSPRHLSRLFRREMGRSPKAVQKAIAMAHARHLLTTSHLTIKEVAASCGFLDSSHFVRDFSGLHRASPTEYRNASWVERAGGTDVISGETVLPRRNNG